MPGASRRPQYPAGRGCEHIRTSIFYKGSTKVTVAVSNGGLDDRTPDMLAQGTDPYQVVHYSLRYIDKT